MMPFIEFLIAPIRDMGLWRILMTSIPATLALLTFFQVHVIIGEFFGWRATPEEQLAARLEAAQCGELVAVPGTTLSQRKDCGPPREWVFQYVRPTPAYQLWDIGFSAKFLRDDCTPTDFRMVLVFSTGQESELTDLIWARIDPPPEGLDRLFETTRSLTSYGANKHFEEEPRGVRVEQIFDCSDGSYRQQHASWLDGIEPVPADHKWVSVYDRR